MLHNLLIKNRHRAQPRALAQDGDETTIYIYEPIVSDDLTAEFYGGVSAQSMVPQIRAIQGGTIHLRISSPGGDVFAAQAIVQAIRDTKAKVIAHIDGLAASAATVIATAADEVEMSDGGLYMIHNAWTFAIGNANDMMETAALLEKCDGIIASQYAKRTGKEIDAIKALMDAETWFTAEEAKEAGLIDSIAEGKKPSASWDLSAYANAPKAQEPEEKLITQEHRERQIQRLGMLARVPLG